jgi:GT2 family glycosyltransferase
MNPIISTIVVNYNSGSFLRHCVDSLINCPLEIEIIIVDNASRDGSLDGLAALPNVRIINNPVNVGFSAACNIGLRVASAPFLLFLNPDCSFVPGTLTTLLDTLRRDADTGMVGALLTNPDGSEQAGGRRAIPTPWRSFVRGFGLSRFAKRWPRLFFDFHLHKQPLPLQPTEVEAISGACMLVKREAMLDVGEWDETYFLHCEDLDWCMRFRQKGWRILFDPTTRMNHALGVCSRSRPVFVEWHKHKGMMTFYRKFFSQQYPPGLMLLVGTGVWLRFALVATVYTAQRLLRSLKA